MTRSASNGDDAAGLAVGSDSRWPGRGLTVFLPLPSQSVACLLASFRGDPERWLPLGEPHGPGRWLLDLRLGPLHRIVVSEVGEVREVGASLVRTLAWWPPGHDDEGWSFDDALPRFDGELILHPGREVLVLDGGYSVPGGRFGELADAALAGLVRRTGSALLSDIVNWTDSAT